MQGDDFDLSGDFAREALRLLSEIEQALLTLEIGVAPDTRRARAVDIERALHTLKGNAGLLGAPTLSRVFHALEDLTRVLGEHGSASQVRAVLSGIDVTRIEVEHIANGRSPDEASPALDAWLKRREQISHGETVAEMPIDSVMPAMGTDVTLPQHRLDALVAAAGDLAVHNAQLQRALADQRSGRTAPTDAKLLRERADRLDSAVRTLNQLVLNVRSVPAARLFQQFERLVRDTARAQGKQARLDIDGSATQIDKAVLDALVGPLVHLVKNAVTHGLETPDERDLAGKPTEGRIGLSAHSAGNRVVLYVEDDGRGLDAVAIKQKASELGLDPDKDVATLIFEPRLSTAPLSEDAGRGLGMDAARRALVALGGQLDFWTMPGAGTRVTLLVPVSIALQRAILCDIAGELYAVPLASVVETVRFDASQVRWLGHGRALLHREKLVPLIDTPTALGTTARAPRYVVFLTATRVAALPVDAVLEQQDFVFQPLDPLLRGVAPVSGAAMLSNGRVVLRLDPEPLISQALTATLSEVRA